MNNKSIHRMRVEDRGNSRAEQQRRCPKCGGSGVCRDDAYSEFPCPFCEAGKRTQVEHNPLSGETTVTHRVTETLKNLQQTDDTDTTPPLDLHTCWYDDDGNVRCSEGW